jgi:hypothetical protein
METSRHFIDRDKLTNLLRNVHKVVTAIFRSLFSFKFLILLQTCTLFVFNGSESMAQDISWKDQYETMQEAPNFLLFIGGNQGIKFGSITTGFKDNIHKKITPYTGYSVAYYSSKVLLKSFLFENEFGVSKRGFLETEKVLCGDFNVFFKGRFFVKRSISPFLLIGAMGYIPLDKTATHQIEKFVRQIGDSYYHYQIGGGGFVFGGGVDFGKPSFGYFEKIAGIELRYGTKLNITRSESNPYSRGYDIRKLYQDKQYFLSLVLRWYIFKF